MIIIVIKIDESKFVCAKQTPHFFWTVTVSPEEVCQSHLTNIFSNYFGKAEVNENVFLESGTPHYVTRFDISMNYFQSVHHSQRQQ